MSGMDEVLSDEYLSGEVRLIHLLRQSTTVETTVIRYRRCLPLIRVMMKIGMECTKSSRVIDEKPRGKMDATLKINQRM